MTNFDRTGRVGNAQLVIGVDLLQPFSSPVATTISLGRNAVIGDQLGAHPLEIQRFDAGAARLGLNQHEGRR
jgi:hypothetical protein